MKQEEDFGLSLHPKKSEGKKVSRKVGEKLRRDRLNNFIAELALEVPLTANCRRRLDKAAILRLTVAYLKLHNEMRKKKSVLQSGWKPEFLTENGLSQLLSEAGDGFLLMVSQQGSVLYVSSEINNVLGLCQTDVIGTKIYSLLHPEDKVLFETEFTPLRGAEMVRGMRRCSFTVRMQFGMKTRMDQPLPVQYELVHILGYIETTAVTSKSEESDQERWMVAVVRVARNQPLRDMSLAMSEFTKNNEWVSYHKMDAVIVHNDQRASLFLGFLASEMLGKTPYSLIHDEDLYYVSRSHLLIMTESEIPSTVFRMKNTFNKDVYVRSASVVVVDQWTKEPKSIVSVNTVLSNEEGQFLLNQQRKKVEAAIKATERLSIEDQNPEQDVSQTQSTKRQAEFRESEDGSPCVLQGLSECDWQSETGLSDVSSLSQSTDDSSVRTFDSHGDSRYQHSLDTSPCSDCSAEQGSSGKNGSYYLPSVAGCLPHSSYKRNGKRRLEPEDIEGKGGDSRVTDRQVCHHCENKERFPQQPFLEKNTGQRKWCQKPCLCQCRHLGQLHCSLCGSENRERQIHNGGPQTTGAQSMLEKLLKGPDKGPEGVVTWTDDTGPVTCSCRTRGNTESLSSTSTETETMTDGVKNVQSPTVGSSVHMTEQPDVFGSDIPRYCQLEDQQNHVKRLLRQQMTLIASLQDQLDTPNGSLSADRSQLHQHLLQRLNEAKETASSQQAFLGQMVNTIQQQLESSQQQGTQLASPFSQGTQLSSPLSQGTQLFQETQLSSPLSQGTQLSSPLSQGTQLSSPLSQGTQLSSPLSQGTQLSSPLSVKTNTQISSPL